MTTKEEIFAQYDIDELKEIFQDGWGSIPDWEQVSDEMNDYDEGNVGYTRVLKHKPTDRFFQLDYWTNSWADYDSDFNISEITEVKPVEVTVTQYVPV